MRAQCAARSATRGAIRLCKVPVFELVDISPVDEDDDCACDEDNAGKGADAGAGAAASSDSALPKKAALVQVDKMPGRSDWIVSKKSN